MKRIYRIILIASMCAMLALTLVLYFQPRAAVRWIAEQSPEVLYFVPTAAPVVALTMDDGPNPIATPQILDLLKEHEARATFFLIGDHIRGNEPLLERMRHEGHELGNHLARDYPSILLSPDQFEKEIVEVDRLIRPTGV